MHTAPAVARRAPRRILLLIIAALLAFPPALFAPATAAAAASTVSVQAADTAGSDYAPPGQGSLPRFDPAPCDFPETPSLTQGLLLECGWLTVPEEHSNPSGPTIQLAVAIIRSQVENPDPIPVVFLQGGPGGSTIDLYLQLIPLNPRLSQLNRDIILFDQRGTLYARPSLFCEETYQLGIDLLNVDLPDEEYDAMYLDALRACRRRLAAEGVNLSAFDSFENAADVDALRRALGYDQVHLYGVSYGTLLALHVLRDYPEGLASVTIDSVVPPQINSIPDQPRVINRGLEALFAACAADAACSRAYPNLRDVFYQQVDKLNENPVSIRVTDYADGRQYPALLDGDTVLYLVIQMLYSTDLIPLIPRAIYQVRAGEYRVVETILSNVVFDRSMSYGMFYSVWCAEEADFDPADVVLEGLPPQLYDEERNSAALFIEACELWDVEPLGDAADAVVTGSVPALVLSGEFDPVTPPEYAEMAAQSLDNAYVYVVPRGGHAQVASGECQDSIFIQFLNDPNRPPDASCLEEEQIVFSTPGALVVMPKAIDLLNPQGTNLLMLALYALALLFLLTAVVVYPVVWLVRLLQRPAAPSAAPPAPYAPANYGAPAAAYAAPVPVQTAAPRRKPFLYRLSPWLAALAAILLLVFILVVYGIAVQMALANDNRILFGLPGSARPLFLLPLLVAVSVLLMWAGAFIAWTRRAGSVWGRLYLSLLALAGVVCVAALVWFGALQALFLG